MNKTLTQTNIINGEWVELGQNLPATTQQAPIARRWEEPVLITQDYLPQPSVVQVVNRCLFDLLETPMNKVNPIERYNRIVLAEVVPMRRNDPVVPVPVVRISSWWDDRQHKSHYRSFFDFMLTFERKYWTWGSVPRNWKRDMDKIRKKIINSIESHVSIGELGYYHDQLVECMVNPFRLSDEQLRSGNGY